MTLTGALVSTGGLALGALVLYWRWQARSGPSWWTSATNDRRAVLGVMPGIAIVLSSFGPFTAAEAGGPLLYWSGLPFMFGLALGTWGWLGPVKYPRWYVPRGARKQP